MVIGGAGGAAIGSLTGDKKTTSTAAVLAPVLASKMKVSNMAAAPSAGNAAGVAAVEPGSTITPQAVSNPNLALGAMLKAYLAKHPEACQLVPIIGQDNVMKLIDQYTGAGGAGPDLGGLDDLVKDYIAKKGK